jgi:hypothetical protein
MTLVAKATEASIDELATTVLAPHFHVDGLKERKVCFILAIEIPFGKKSDMQLKKIDKLSTSHSMFFNLQGTQLT